MYDACHAESSPSRTAPTGSYNINHHFPLLCNVFVYTVSFYLFIQDMVESVKELSGNSILVADITDNQSKNFKALKISGI